MPAVNKQMVRKGKPEYVRKSEQVYPTEDPAPRASIKGDNGYTDDADCYPTEDAQGNVQPLQSAAPRSPTPTAVAAAHPTSRKPPKAASTAAAKASLQRHREVAAPIQALMQLLLRSRDASQDASGAAAEVTSHNATPEEMRPVLDAIRDYCVAMIDKTKLEGGSAAAGRAQLGSVQANNDDDLNGFFAVTFLSTLFFANEADDMLRESLESAVERLRAAEAHGSEEKYHNAVVDAVNSILLFTPLTAPPVWLLNGERKTTAESQSPARRRRAPKGKESPSSATATATAAAPNGSAGSRRASIMVDAAAEAALEDMAAVVRAMLHKMDHPEDEETQPNEGMEDEDEAKAPAMILEDDCIDYLASNGGSPCLDEQHWFDVWLSVLLKGYVHLSASAIEDCASRRTDGEAAAGDAEEEDGGACAAVPTLLPRPVWRSAANNAYAQFAVQLLAIFFARGSDGSLNYCARVHRLVQYYHHRLRQSASSCAPIPTENAARPAPPPKAAPKQHSRGVVSNMETAEKQTQTVVVEAPPATDDEAEYPVEEQERSTKKVMLFHPSVERSRTRASRALEPTPAPEDEEMDEEVDEEGEELPDPLTAGFSRFHKCYTAAEDLHFIAKKRIPVDAEEYPTEEDDAAQAADRQHKCYTADQQPSTEGKQRVAPPPEDDEEQEEKPKPEEAVDEEQPEEDLNEY